MKHLLRTLFVVHALACCSFAQTVGQWELRKRTTTGMQSYGITAENGKAIGFSAGVPAMLSISGGGAGLDNIASSITGATLTLSGSLTTGRILTVRDLAGTIALTTDLADYLTTSSAASTYASLSGNYSNPSWITSLAWSKISGTPTTLAGYGITDALTSAAAASTYASLSGSYSDPAWVTSLARTKLTGPIATVISSDTTLVSNRTYMLAMDGDTTLTLPASPSDGDVIIVNQSESTWTGMLTIARNGNTINGASENLVYYSPGFGRGWWRATYLGTAATWQVSMVYDTVLASMVYAPGSHIHPITSIGGNNANRLYGTGGTFANGQEITVGSGLNLSSGSLTVPANGITNTMLAGSIAASKLIGTDITTVGTITTGAWNGTTIAIANGGTGQTSQTAAFDALAPTTTKGDITVHNGTDNVRLAGGTNGHVLTRDSTTAVGVKWAAATGGSATTDSRLYTADDTWTNPSPSTPKRVFVRLVGGGGGGGSGRRGASGEVRCGGGGGAAGAVVEFWTLTTELGTTETVTVGAGGTGGASQTTNSTNGNAGSAGGDTLFNGGPPARGGGGGGGGTNAAGTAGANATNATTIGVATANPSSGGAASGTGSTGAAGVTSVASLPTGGGAGGGISSANQATSGGNGGPIGNTPLGTLSGGTAGAWNGTLAGGTGNAGRGSGTGGGGGAGSTSGNAGAGGAGGGFGTGGGGGGSSTNDVGNSGPGGAGASGYALIITFL